jgi:hypothetical protein
MVSRPSLPSEGLDGWRRASDTEETPFSAPGLTVTARVLVYEDATLQAAVRERTGVDRSLRFFLAGRLELAPSPPVTGALRGLVASRASRGFADRLESRGLSAVERVERRSLRVGDDDARLFRYEAACALDRLALDVEGWLAVWAPDGAFRLAGGAYPTAVTDGDADVAALLDPDAFRTDLFDLIRATG